MPGLDDLYREVILDHYRSPRNQGELETPPAVRTEGFNPLCGDEVIVFIDVDDPNVITDIAIGGQGCSISQASASMMSAAIKGTSMGEARQFISAFKGKKNETYIFGFESDTFDSDDIKQALIGALVVSEDNSGSGLEKPIIVTSGTVGGTLRNRDI